MKLCYVSTFAVGAILSVAALPASAGTISCPGTLITTDREFTLTTTPTAGCLATGNGNLTGNSDAINALGYVTLDKSDDALMYQGTLNELSVSGVGTTGGTFSFTAPTGYHNFVIAFKSGVGQLDPDWAAFALPAGVVSGSWSIAVGSQSLSHVNLYGRVCGGTGVPCDPLDVPEPTSLALVGLGLLGAGLARRRK